MNQPSHYNLLRGIASFLRILGWIVLALGVIGAIVMLFANLPGFLKWVGLFLALATGISWFVPLYGFGSVLFLLLDIEENTRLLASQQPSS